VIATPVHRDDQCLTVAEIAERLNVKPDTVRRLFMKELGVIVISFPRKGRRVYRTLRILLSVYQRALTRARFRAAAM
jgi:transcriptional regulator GlxA family with amidase domain